LPLLSCDHSRLSFLNMNGVPHEQVAGQLSGL
jgi:hypothetical protein